MQLVVADIDTHHAASPLLQQAMGEPTRGLPDVQALQVPDRQARVLQSPFELESATRHVASLSRIEQAHFGAHCNVVAVLAYLAPRQRLGRTPFDTGGNQPLGLRPRRGQAALDEKLINTHVVFRGVASAAHTATQTRDTAEPALPGRGCRPLEGERRRRTGVLNTCRYRACTALAPAHRYRPPAPWSAWSAARRAWTAAGGPPSRPGAWAAHRPGRPCTRRAW